jgi:hypothetical protein
MRLGVRNVASRHALSRHFTAASEKAGTFRCKDTGIGEAVAATVVYAEQHALSTVSALPTSKEAE